VTAALKVSDLTVEELRELIRAELGAPKPEPDTYVDSEEIQRIYGISRGTVHNWVHKESCPHEMRGKILRFRLAAVEAWFRGRVPLRKVR
jgi:predicted DNA-binding transcriptional regulator AlpA